METQRLSRPSPSFRLRSSSLNAVRLRRVFDLFDHNGDGEITMEELALALDRLGLGADPSDLRFTVETYIREGRKGLGEGGDGEMEEAFKVFDEDGDGFISEAELQAVLAKLGLVEGRSMARVHEMICSVDRNHDGRVDFNEFKGMMRSISLKSA
ncbi:putative EF-hand domain-containing protein [Dioscorea sansibarensis]